MSFHQAPVPIPLPIRPPHWASFAQSSFSAVHCPASGCQGVDVGGLGLFDGPAGVHQIVDQALPLLLTEAWVCGSPEPASHNEVAAVWGGEGIYGVRVWGGR